MLVDFSVNGTLPQARLDVGASFTVREWSNNGTYNYTKPDLNVTFNCMQVIETFEDPYNRYRQASFATTVENCRDIITRDATDGSHQANFTVSVWPMNQPVGNGTVYDLDAGDRTINEKGRSFFTVRSSEMVTETGFMYDGPYDHQFVCVDLLDTNYGNYSTGYNQWLFQAKDDQLTCNETVELKHSVHSPTPGRIENITISVDKAACEYVQCPANEVQDAWTCACMTAPETLGILYDFDADDRNRVARVRVGDFFTMRESSNTTEGRTYTWEIPQTDNLTCVQKVSEGDTGYYRQAVFEALEGNCSYSLNRSMVGADVNQTIEFRVFPDTEPPRTGTFFDMDVSADRNIEINKNAYLTVRMNEGATDHGYAWEVPKPDLQCVTLINDNYGDFVTGIQQWVFQANDVYAHCTDTVVVTRSANWEDCPLCEDTFTIGVSPIEAADPNAIVESIFEEGDSEAVRAAKEICNDDDQSYWDTATDDCIPKCDSSSSASWFNTATSQCEQPSAQNLD